MLSMRSNIVILSILFLFILNPWQSTAEAALGVPPVIDTSLVTINAPKSGATVYVELGVGTLNPVDVDTRFWVENVTQGTVTLLLKYDASKGAIAKVIGAGGDNLKLYATNGGTNTAEANIGYVPNPSDSARPDFELSNISGPSTIDANGDYHITGAIGALLDESFPLTATIEGSSLPSQVITAASGSSTSNIGFDFTLTGYSIGDRVVLRVTDDYGNWSNLHFEVGPDVAKPVSSFYPANYESANKTEAERLGVAHTVRGVSFPSLFYSTVMHLLSVDGMSLDTNFSLNYSSDLSYDGNLGRNWEWIFDSRLNVQNIAGQPCVDWYDGYGNMHRFDNPNFIFSPHFQIVYESPSGTFERLAWDMASSGYKLEKASGAHLFFENDGLLSKIVDPYGNSIKVVRNLEDRVVEIIDDLDRKYVVSWFYHSGGARLAEIRDFGGRKTRLSYDGNGNLTQLILPDGCVQSYEYAAGTITPSKSLLKKIIDPSGSQLVSVDYNAQDQVVSTQDQYEFSHGVSTSYAQSLNPISSANEIVVTSPYRFEDSSSSYTYATVRYGSSALPSGAPEFIRTYSVSLDRSPSVGYQSPNGDPLWWETHAEYNSDYLKTREYKKTEGVAGITEETVWEYLANPSNDARRRTRVQFIKEFGDGTQASKQKEWTYSGDSFWPDTYINELSTITEYEYNQAGLVTKTSIIGVEYATSSNLYDIIKEDSYDSDGRIIGSWDANRVANHGDSQSSAASVLYEYYTSGHQKGYLKSVTHQDHLGNANSSISRVFEYDIYGRQIKEINAEGEIWIIEYDDLDRNTRFVSPEVDRTLPGASGVIVNEVITEYEGLNLKKKKIRFDSIDGLNPTRWSTTDYTYSVYGFVDFIESDLFQSGANTVRKKIAYSYTPSGQEKEVIEYGPDETGSASFVSSRYRYDARGLLVTKIEDPDYGSSIDNGNEIKTWYLYNNQGDIVEAHSSDSDPVTINYDGFGRKVSSESSVIDLGLAHEGDPTALASTATAKRGIVLKEWEYFANDKIKISRSKSKEENSNEWLTTKESRFDLDKAGRTIRTYEARVWNPSAPTITQSDATWSVWSKDFYPDGKVWKEWAAAGQGYKEFLYDDLNQLVTTIDEVGNIRNVEYDSFGKIDFIEWKPFDETVIPPANAYPKSYRTYYDYDQIGRVISMKNIGSGPSAEHTGVKYVFDGLGRVQQKIPYNFSTSSSGIPLTKKYSIGGLLLESTSGDSVIIKKETYEYNQFGRLTAIVENPDSSSGGRTTSFKYDGLGREILASYPSGGSGARESITSYHDNSHNLESETLPNGVKRNYSYNNFGNLLSIDIDKSIAPNHIKGPERIDFRYGSDNPKGPGFLISRAPVISTTFATDVPDDFLTITRQHRSPQSLLVHDQIQINRNCDESIITTNFEYDAAHNRTKVTHPVVGTSVGARVRRDYRKNGSIQKTLVYQGAGYHTTAHHYYSGNNVLKTEVFDVDPQSTVEEDPVNLLYSRNTVLDELERPKELEMIRADGVLLLRDEIKRDWQGLVTSKLQADGNWSHMNHKDGLLEDAVFGDTNSSSPDWNNVSGTVGGTEYVHRDIEYNDFNEVSSVIEDNGIAGETVGWSLNRDQAGYIQSRSPIMTFDDKEFVKYYGPSQDDNESIKSINYLVDDGGISHTTNYILQKQKPCGSLPPVVEDVEASVAHLRYYDAWGRIVGSERRTVYTAGIDCSNTLPADQLHSVDLLRDAFGRTVHYKTVGDGDLREVMIAYEDGSIIATILMNDPQSCSPVVRMGGRVPSFPPGQGPPGPDGEPGQAVPEFRCDIGPLCGDVDPAEPLIFEAYTLDADLSGRVVLSNRDFDDSRDDNPQQSTAFFTRTFSPWGNVMSSDYEDFLPPDGGFYDPATEGFEDWLVAEGSGQFVIPEHSVVASSVSFDTGGEGITEGVFVTTPIGAFNYEVITKFINFNNLMDCLEDAWDNYTEAVDTSHATLKKMDTINVNSKLNPCALPSPSQAKRLSDLASEYLVDLEHIQNAIDELQEKLDAALVMLQDCPFLDEGSEFAGLQGILEQIAGVEFAQEDLDEVRDNIDDLADHYKDYRRLANPDEDPVGAAIALAGGAAGRITKALAKTKYGKKLLLSINRRTGRAAEEATREAYQFGRSRKYSDTLRRIADGVTKKGNRVIISEVKWKRRQALSAQLKDYINYAKQSGAQFHLYLKPGCYLSKPLQAALKKGVKEGHVKVKQAVIQ